MYYRICLLRADLFFKLENMFFYFRLFNTCVVLFFNRSGIFLRIIIIMNLYFKVDVFRDG